MIEKVSFRVKELGILLLATGKDLLAYVLVQGNRYPVLTTPWSRKSSAGRNNNIAEAEKMGIVLVFFGEEISNIKGTREVGNEDFGTTMSIANSHVADV